MWSRLDASTTNIESGWSVYVTSPNGTTILEINWDAGKGKLPATYLKQSLLTPPPPPLTPSPPNMQAQNSPCEWPLGWQQLAAGSWCRTRCWQCACAVSGILQQQRAAMVCVVVPLLVLNGRLCTFRRHAAVQQNLLLRAQLHRQLLHHGRRRPGLE